MSQAYLGISFDPERPGELGVAVLSGGIPRSRVFSLEEREPPISVDTEGITEIPVVRSILDFVLESVGDQLVDVVIVTPARVVPSAKILLGAMQALGGRALAYFAYLALPDGNLALGSDFIHLLRTRRGAGGPLVRSENSYLYTGVVNAFLGFVSTGGPTLGRLASAAAVILSHPGLFYFLTSPGEPYSSQDISHFLDRRKHGLQPSFNNSLLFAGFEYMKLDEAAPPPAVSTHRMHLDYALSAKKSGLEDYPGAPPRAHLKFGVLGVCRKYKLRLSCASLRDERNAKERIVELSRELFEQTIQLTANGPEMPFPPPDSMYEPTHQEAIRATLELANDLHGRGMPAPAALMSALEMLHEQTFSGDINTLMRVYLWIRFSFGDPKWVAYDPAWDLDALLGE